MRPELVVTTATTTETLSPEADTYLAASTTYGQGAKEWLTVRPNNENILIRFDSTSFPAPGELEQATLRLWNHEDFGGGTMTIGVFRSSQGQQISGEPVMGLAAGYPGDAGIENHPNVLFSTDFESGTWKDEWTIVDNLSECAFLLYLPVRSQINLGGFFPFSKPQIS